MIQMNFGGSLFDFVMDENLLDYVLMVEVMGCLFGKFVVNFFVLVLVVGVIWKVVNDIGNCLRYCVGFDVEVLLDV